MSGGGLKTIKGRCDAPEENVAPISEGQSTSILPNENESNTPSASSTPETASGDSATIEEGSGGVIEELIETSTTESSETATVAPEESAAPQELVTEPIIPEPIQSAPPVEPVPPVVE